MRSALYYPHTTIENEGLVKTALLLWDRLEFIVPWENFRPHHADRQMARALELIGVPRCPDDNEKKEAHTRIKELIDGRLPPQFFLDHRRRSDEPYEVYPQKLLPKTWSLLQKASLSGKLLPNSDYPMSEFGGLMVMSILADSCAGTTRARVTDRGEAYATISSYLGNDPQGPKIKRSDASEQLVPVSLKVLDAPSMKLTDLIELREREEKESGHSLRDLRHRYVASLEDYVSKITNQKATKADAQTILNEYAQDMERDLRELRKELGFAFKDAILSKEMLVTALAAVGTVASWALDVPVSLTGIVTTGGVPVTIGGLLAVRNKYLSARHTIMKNHPMAYLYEIQK
jgi:hypothetical protein